MANEEKVIVPEAPANLPEKVKKAWVEKFSTALKQATIDYPDNPGAQRAAAIKVANQLLSVPAPESAKDIDKLEDWQVLVRGERAATDGSKLRHCVTIDGRKYSFPILPQKPAPAAA